MAAQSGWQLEAGQGYPHSLYPAANGQTWLFYTHDFDLIGKKLNVDGAVVETVALGTAGADVWPTADNGFVSAVLEGGDWYGVDRLVVEKRDGGGQLVWQKTFPDTVLLNGIALTPTADGGFWLASLPQHVITTQPIWTTTVELRLRRLDAGGNVLNELHLADELPFVSFASLRQLLVQSDEAPLLLLNISVTGTDRSYRLWRFAHDGAFLGQVAVDQEGNFTSGASVNLDTSGNLLLASDWATAEGLHHAVWRTVGLSGSEIFHQTIEAKPVAQGQYHQPAALAMVELGCGDYLTLLHLTNFTLEAWSPDGERRWQRPLPGPANGAYFTPGFPPARYGRFLLPTSDGGAVVALPGNGTVRLLKINCNGLSAPDGVLAQGRIAHDDDYDCESDPEETGPGVSLPVSLVRDGEEPAIVWADADGRFDLPLEAGAWLVQPWAANGLDPWPEVSPICDLAQAVLVFPGDPTAEVSLPLAATSGVNPEPGAAAGWKVYPNPATDRLIVQRRDELSGDITITVWSAQGQLVYREHSNGSPILELAVANWTPGVYRLEVENAGRRQQLRVVKAPQ